MKTLGIDYGRRKVGLAIADGPLAEPLQVIRYSDADVLKEKLNQIIKGEKIEKVIVGVSEGEMGKESENFAREIGAETFDETLSTRDAQTLSREAGISRKKRRELEDAYAAAIMLQNWLDN